MTALERQQPPAFFIRAGRNSYHLGVDIAHNPYRDLPYRDWWAKGYLEAKAAFEKVWLPQPRPERNGNTGRNDRFARPRPRN